MSHPKTIPARVTSAVYFASLIVLIVCSYVGLGDFHDEAEHCHVAWLVGKAGLTPIKDFFEHHQSLLWDVLKLYYFSGCDGPQIYYFGRMIVVACLIISGISLTFISKNTSIPHSENAQSVFPGTIPVVFLLVVYNLLGTLFVIRPETLSTAFVFVSILLWNQERNDARSANIVKDITAGILYGLAIYASPRYLLFGGMYFFELNDSRRIFVRWSRLLPMFCSSALSILLYVVISKVPLEYLKFNILFSAHLQHIGRGSTYTKQFLFFLFLIPTSSIALYLTINKKSRTKYLSIMSYLLLIIILSFVSMGKYPYPQSFCIPVCIIAVVFAWAERKIEWDRLKYACVTTAALIVIVDTIYITATMPTIFNVVSFRQYLTTLLHKKDKVMVGAQHHPICAIDASYYYLPLTDSPNRLCNAINSFKTDLPLPTCNMAADFFDNKPALVDDIIIYNDILRRADSSAFNRLINGRYAEVAFGTYVSVGNGFQQQERK